MPVALRRKHKNICISWYRRHHDIVRYSAIEASRCASRILKMNTLRSLVNSETAFRMTQRHSTEEQNPQLRGIEISRLLNMESL